jgi:N-acetylmuramoyl-L-alanine amidase
VAFPVAHPKPKRAPRPEPPLFNLDTIVLDPAHGGQDNGAKITDSALEKDVNLAFANRLKELLSTRGFTVLMTRTADLAVPKPPDPDAPTAPPAKPVENFTDQRIETANRSRAVACILIHASNGGHGVHIYTSSLTPPSALVLDPDQPKPIVAWDTAQSASVPNSLLLANDLSTALNNIRIPLVLGRASVSPIDSMTCPAIALELSPLATEDGQTPASDAGYQSRVADAVAAALVFWRGHAQSLAEAQQPKPATSAEPTPPVVKKPKPKPITPPVEVPEQSSPAPIVRKTPAPPPPPMTNPGAPTR